MFLRKLGPSRTCAAGAACPDIIEMESGDYAVVGLDITNEAAGQLPVGCGCASNERVVRIPRNVLIEARGDIPKAS